MLVAIYQATRRHIIVSPLPESRCCRAHAHFERVVSRYNVQQCNKWSLSRPDARVPTLRPEVSCAFGESQLYSGY